MAEKQKNLCAMIPVELHEQVRAAQEQAGLTLSAYITELLTNYYEKRGNEKWRKVCALWRFRFRKKCSSG